MRGVLSVMKTGLLSALCAGLVLLGGVPALRAEEKVPSSAGAGLELSTLAGEHEVRGRNPDGSEYKGKVTIRVKGPLVLLEWNTNGELSYGSGLVEGMTLGVALESGVAIYKIVPQAEGKSLVGLWVAEGGETACEETIFIGDADVGSAEFEVEKINGSYRALSGGVQGASVVTISGGDIVKRLEVRSGDHAAEAEGLALGDGLAVITPDGLSVFQILRKGKKVFLAGRSADGTGQVREVRLEPEP